MHSYQLIKYKLLEGNTYCHTNKHISEGIVDNSYSLSYGILISTMCNMFLILAIFLRDRRCWTVPAVYISSALVLCGKAGKSSSQVKRYNMLTGKLL